LSDLARVKPVRRGRRLAGATRIHEGRQRCSRPSKSMPGPARRRLPALRAARYRRCLWIMRRCGSA
jgi:hypothetical protein